MSEHDHPGLDPFEHGKWQGRVETRLDNVESAVRTLETTLDGLPDRLERRFVKVINGRILVLEAGKSGNPESSEAKDESTVKWKDITKDFLLPLILSGAGAVIAIMVAKAIGAL